MVEQKQELDEEKQFYFDTISKLEDAHFLEEILKSEKWEVMRRVWLKTRDWAQQKLNGEDPNNTLAIMRWQMMIDFYDNVLQRSIEDYRRLGKEAYDNANNNGWLGKIAIYLKTF